MLNSNAVYMFHEVGQYKSGFSNEHSKYNIPLNKFRKFLACINHNSLITFDDGGVSNYDAAFIAAEEFGFKVILFIPTNYISKTNFLSKSQILDLISHPLISIGSHSASHPRVFNKLSMDNKILELESSKIVLEELLSVPVKDFSFPGGISDKSDFKLASNYFENIYNSWRFIFTGNGINRISVENSNLELFSSDKPLFLKNSYCVFQDLKLLLQLTYSKFYEKNIINTF